MPGGHIEHGEPARDAPQREILEEMGGCLQRLWRPDGLFRLTTVNGEQVRGVYRGEGGVAGLAQHAQTDEELLRRVQQRDNVAFEMLFERYEAPLHRHVANTLRDPEMAHDVVQEAFLRVWIKAESWHEEGSCRAWLYRIATNLALNQLRTIGRRREQSLPIQTAITEDDEESCVPGWLVDTVTCNPQAALEQAEQHRLLHQLVNKLPEGKRDVVRLVYEEELDSHEVARRLAIPSGTVRSRLHHARKTLARLWQEHASHTD